MKLAVLGLGNAGGKITDKLIWFERESDRDLIRSAVAVNSARVDLARLEHLPDENRFLIGQTNPQVKGHGVGGDPDLGAEITQTDQYEIERALDAVPVHEVDGFLLVAGLGGGTGSGAAPSLARTLQTRYDEPVYGLGVLPSKDEGGRALLNAARSFQGFADAVTNLILFDNDIWRGSGDTVEGGYDRTNEEIAKRLVTLLGAGEIDGSRISENAMDSSDIRRTLMTGGVSTIAYAKTPTPSHQGLLSRFRSNGTDELAETDPATRVNGLIRKATQSRLTCPAAVESAERSLIVVSGPPDALSRKGIESGRKWLEDQTKSAEVLTGDDPRDGTDHLAAAILLSNVTEVPTVDRLQELAIDAQENIDTQQALRDQEIANLVQSDQNPLEPL